MIHRRWPWFLLAVVLAGAVWLLPRYVTFPWPVAHGYEAHGAPHSLPLAEVVPDPRPPFRLDPGAPWRLTLGRGSGWHGLDTVEVGHDGSLVLYRMAHRRRRKTIVVSWQTATAQLPPDATTKVFDAVEANGLLGLAKAYHANVADGTQWVLWVRQGEREKAVYFNNHFPDAIVRFADRLDTIVAEAVGSDLRWWGVPSAREREHEKDLWGSIRR